MEMEYQQNEIVWAKIIGYPWWPGAISERLQLQDRNLYKVLFLGENSYCQLSGKKLAKFLPNQQFKLQANNDRRLRESIEVAQRIVAGLADLRTELTKLQSKTQAKPRNLSKKKSDHSQSQRLEESKVLSEPCRAMEVQIDDTVVACCQQQIDAIDIHEGNVTELLESGLLAKLKGLPEEKASRCRRFFKKILLQKYFSKKTEFRKRIVVVEKKPRTKPIQKLQKAPSKPKTVRSPQAIQMLCVRKLYSVLKVYNLDTDRAKALSVQSVKKLQDEAIAGSQRFISAFTSLFSWIKLNSSSADLAEQLSLQLATDSKFPEEEQTVDSKTKHFYQTSSSVF